MAKKDVGMVAEVKPSYDTALLTAAEERELAERVKAGDKTARDKFICCNQGLVKMIASKYVNVCVGLDFDDLCQVGNIGLMNAVERFDSDKGFRFSTYAIWWIRQAITREIMSKGNIVHIPVHMHEKFRAVKRAVAKIEQTTGKPATVAEVATALGETEEKIAAYLELLNAVNAVSIDKPLDDDDSISLIDMLSDDGLSPQDAADAMQLHIVMAQAIGNLSPREQAVLKMRFGLIDGIAHTLEDVGEAYGVTRERVRQIEAKALRRLRNPRIASLLKDFLD